MKHPDLVDEQLAVMNVLWERGSATVREASEALGDELPLRTLRTIVHTLEENGYLRAELEGGAYRYRPTVTRREAGRRAAGRVLERFFGGSVETFARAVAGAAGRPNGKIEKPRAG